MERQFPKDIPLDQLLGYMQWQADYMVEVYKDEIAAEEITLEEAIKNLNHMDGIILALQELMHLKGAPHSATCPMHTLAHN